LISRLRGTIALRAIDLSLNCSTVPITRRRCILRPSDPGSLHRNSQTFGPCRRGTCIRHPFCIWPPFDCRRCAWGLLRAPEALAPRVSVRLWQEGRRRLITSAPSHGYRSFVPPYDGIAGRDSASEVDQLLDMSRSVVGTNIGTSGRGCFLLDPRFLEGVVAFLQRWLSFQTEPQERMRRGGRKHNRRVGTARFGSHTCRPVKKGW
jgi:hypothetical protein